MGYNFLQKGPFFNKSEFRPPRKGWVGIAHHEVSVVEAGTVGGAHPTGEEAEACFLKAIDIARKQQAKSWELRAATSLARLWQHQGKKAEAHHLLSETYAWFTEGFATRDLQEAKAQLEELQKGYDSARSVKVSRRIGKSSQEAKSRTDGDR